MPGLDHAKVLGPGVLAFSTDGRSDFHHGDPFSPECFCLTAQQRDRLKDGGLPNPDDIIFPKQVHGDAVWVVTGLEVECRGLREADAVVTNKVGVPVAVRTADCLPLLIFDPVRRVVAAVHAGWKSARLGIAARTVAVMRDNYGALPSDLRAAIGPCIRRDSYQVGDEFRGYFPEDVMESPRGLCLDLAGANIRQLLAAGVRLENIHDCGLDTFSDQKMHSFRRDADAAGRMIHVIMLAG